MSDRDEMPNASGSPGNKSAGEPCESGCDCQSGCCLNFVCTAITNCDTNESLKDCT